MKAQLWTTHWPAEIVERFSIDELHQVLFEPCDWPGYGAFVSLGLPECELIVSFPTSNGEPVTHINRPKENRNVNRWLRLVCELATEHRALLAICCDTKDQTKLAARRVAKWLPNHRRMAMERLLAGPGGRVRARMS
jgi:hypothetical protein